MEELQCVSSLNPIYKFPFLPCTDLRVFFEREAAFVVSELLTFNVPQFHFNLDDCKRKTSIFENQIQYSIKKWKTCHSFQCFVHISLVTF